MNPETFRMKRFIRLLGLELRLNAAGIGYGAAALFCVLTARWMLSKSLFQDRFLAVDFGFFLLTGGLILTSMTFSDLASSDGARALLLLPASRLEKYLMRYVQTSFLIVAGGLSVYGVFFLTASGVNALAGGKAIPMTEPHPDILYRVILYFLIIHPVFFLGSLYFKRWALPKTFISVMVFSFLLQLFAVGLGRLAFRHAFFGPDEDILLFSGKIHLAPGYLSNSLFVPFRWLLNGWTLMPLYLLKWWPFLILPVFFLLIGYHRFSEAEEIHGIS